MTQEEKAKRYDEVINILKGFMRQDADPLLTKADALNYLPELAKNEDEEIRKAVIYGMHALKSQHKTCFASIPIDNVIAWLEKQDKKVKSIEGFNTEFERQISHLIASIINKEHEYTEAFVKWTSDTLLNYAKHEINKQGEDKKEINNFDVLPGLYKCVRRMFDGTPEGKLLFEVGEIYKCLSKHDRAEFEVSYGHSVYLEDPVVRKHFIPFEKQVEQKPVNKVKPKFKVGDYIERKDGLGCHAKIIFVGKNVYGCKKLIYPEDSSPFFKLMFENQDEFRISSDFQQKPIEWSKKDSLYYDDICEILINLLHSESPNVNKSAIQKDLDWLITFVNQAKK